MALKGKPKRPAFFHGYWFDENFQPTHDRITRPELREIWRLWTKHKDIRTGKAAGMT